MNKKRAIEILREMEHAVWKKDGKMNTTLLKEVINVLELPDTEKGESMSTEGYSYSEPPESTVTLTVNNLSQEEASAMLKYEEYYLSCLDMDNYFRNMLKYVDLPDGVYDELEKARTFLNDTMTAKGVSLLDMR